MSNAQYKTTELELASFLKAQGQRLLRAQLKGRLVEFSLSLPQPKVPSRTTSLGRNCMRGSFSRPTAALEHLSNK